jgi:hypothetical protein
VRQFDAISIWLGPPRNLSLCRISNHSVSTAFFRLRRRKIMLDCRQYPLFLAEEFPNNGVKKTR